MRSLLFLATALVALTAVHAKSDRVVCYFGSWSVYRQGNGKFFIDGIDPTLCTHMIYTFVGLGNNGDSIRILDSWADLPNNYGKDGFGKFNKLKEKSPNTKTLIAIGGWNEGSSKYSTAFKNPATRTKFIDNAIAFTKQHGFDGFDLDWEYPNQRDGSKDGSDKDNFVALLKEMYPRFQEEGLLLTAAVGAAESSASQSYHVKDVADNLDFVNLMAYDMHGHWASTLGYNAPLYAAQDETGMDRNLNVDACVKYWLNEGAPADKLVVGTAFYGRTFTLADPTNTKRGAPALTPAPAGQYTREPGFMGYNEICENIQAGGWTVEFDEEQRVPYAFSGNKWVGYENVKSLKEKAEYIKENGLGGAMLWSIETDDFSGVCGEKYPLLKTLNAVLRTGQLPDESLPSKPAPTVSYPPATKPPSSSSKPPTRPPPTPSAPPSDGVCQREGYNRDPVDCSKFYYCQGDRIFEFNCPADLYFDTYLSVCNYPDQVDC